MCCCAMTDTHKPQYVAMLIVRVHNAHSGCSLSKKHQCMGLSWF
jgi:hypothetical protein